MHSCRCMVTIKSDFMVNTVYSLNIYQLNGWKDKINVNDDDDIGPAVLSSDMTSAYVLYFPAAAAATTPPPPIFPNHTNYQII